MTQLCKKIPSTQELHQDDAGATVHGWIQWIDSDLPQRKRFDGPLEFCISIYCKRDFRQLFLCRSVAINEGSSGKISIDITLRFPRASHSGSVKRCVNTFWGSTSAFRDSTLKSSSPDADEKSTRVERDESILAVETVFSNLLPGICSISSIGQLW